MNIDHKVLNSPYWVTGGLDGSSVVATNGKIGIGVDSAATHTLEVRLTLTFQIKFIAGCRNLLAK